MKKTVVLTSGQNFVWHSMQEIIPEIERSWSSTQVADSHQVDIINVDDLRLSHILPRVIDATHIVLACFTLRLCQIGKLLREKFKIDARFIIYVHNQASIGFWPFLEWGLGEVLRSSDLFICSSSRDALSLNQVFFDPRSEVVPFTLPELGRSLLSAQTHPNKPESNSEMDQICFAYIGRISSQKNIHTLIEACHILTREHQALPFRLEIYGKEDGLGSPNMGVRDFAYEDFLKNLIKSVTIEARIQWMGHWERIDLNERMTRNKPIFVSASLHADENFGMAAFRALCGGQLAVLSDWGGHYDFKSAFKEQVFLVKAYGDSHGPFISPADLALQMSDAAKFSHANLQTTPPNPYCPMQIKNRLLDFLHEARHPDRQLQFTSLARDIHSFRKKYQSEGSGPCQIFSSYSDPLAQPLFKAYGMTQHSNDQKHFKGKILKTPAWVRYSNNAFHITDPHRGHNKMDISLAKDGRPVETLDGTQILVDLTNALELMERGYVY